MFAKFPDVAGFAADVDFVGVLVEVILLGLVVVVSAGFVAPFAYAGGVPINEARYAEAGKLRSLISPVHQLVGIPGTVLSVILDGPAADCLAVLLQGGAFRLIEVRIRLLGAVNPQRGGPEVAAKDDELALLGGGYDVERAVLQKVRILAQALDGAVYVGLRPLAWVLGQPGQLALIELKGGHFDFDSRFFHCSLCSLYQSLMSAAFSFGRV